MLGDLDIGCGNAYLLRQLLKRRSDHVTVRGIGREQFDFFDNRCGKGRTKDHTKWRGSLSRNRRFSISLS